MLEIRIIDPVEEANTMLNIRRRFFGRVTANLIMFEVCVSLSLVLYRWFASMRRTSLGMETGELRILAAIKLVDVSLRWVARRGQ